MEPGPVDEARGTDADDQAREAAGRNPAPEVEPAPRAFAQGTGVVLQTVGVILFLITCCVCSLSFVWDPARAPWEALTPEAMQTSERPTRLGEALAHPGRAGLMLTIATMSVGGLALAAFGLGLQTDRGLAAWGAAITAAAMLALLVIAGTGLWIGAAPIGVRIGHGVLTLLVIALNGFAFAALRQVRSDPPPANIDVVPPGTKIPYSFYHDDPPEVRMRKELDRRRTQLEAEKAEINRLTAELEEKSRSDDATE